MDIVERVARVMQAWTHGEAVIDGNVPVFFGGKPVGRFTDADAAHEHVRLLNARAALAAMLEAVGEPVAWRYELPETGPTRFWEWRDTKGQFEGWTETPLYSLAALREEL